MPFHQRERKGTKFGEDGSRDGPSFNVNTGGNRNAVYNNDGFSNKRQGNFRDDRDGGGGGRPQKFSRRNDYDDGYDRRRNNYRYGDQEHKEEEQEEVQEVKHEEQEEKPKGTFPLKKGAKEYYKDAKFKEFRLIVRNLPFRTTRGDLQNACSNFGPFSEIVLPESKKMKGKCAGYCFIQFKSREIAIQAKDHFNNNKFLNRSVAADWALDKDTYETSAHDEKQTLKQKVKEEKEDRKPPVKEESDSDSDEEVDEKRSSEEDGTKDDEEEKDKKPTNKKENKNDRAVEEQRVVFLRNISFDTDQETLKEEISKYGAVSLAIICKFKDSGHSKGTAFVHFSSPEGAAACVAAAENEEIVIDDRTISAVLAVPREKAAEMEKDKLTKTPSDKRNLRLLRFALIREGTSAANGMSAEDATKRERLAQATRKKLENLHMFVSPVRLVIHNLPPSMADAKLKTICREAGGEGSFVSECRIWKDMQRLNAKGEPRSKGFAFVSFLEHKHAMECLKKLNNNPTTFTNEKRPIVEFSVEDLTALQTKERRAAASSGQKVNQKEINDKVRKQVQESIGEVHTAGMKFLPKFLGKKMRHRNMSNAKKKKLGILKDKSKSKGAKKPAPEVRKKAKDGKKTVTKYLALS